MKQRCRTLGLVAILLASTAPQAGAANVSDFGLRINGANFRNGTTGLYTIYVANAGPQASNDRVTLNLRLPDGFRYRSGGGDGFACDAAGSEVTCVRQTPMGLGSASFFLQVDVCGSAGRVTTYGTIAYAGDDNLSSNATSRDISVKAGACTAQSPTAPVATATSPAAPAATSTPPPLATAPPTATATATATSPAAGAAATDIAVSLLRASTFRAGGSGVYFLVISNQGQVATNVPIAASLVFPTGLSFLNSEGAGWSCTNQGATAACSFAGSLAARSTTSLIIRARVARSAPSTVISAAYVTYPNDTDPSDNASPRPTSIRR